MKNKVWIELPNNNQKEHAELATIMLHKLGYSDAVKIFWSDRQSVYCLQINSNGEFLELSDNGHWFDLDFIAKV